MRLSQKFIDQLKTLPESGMGYQIANIKLKNNKILKNIIIINGEKIGDGIVNSSDDIAEITLNQKFKSIE